MPQDQLQQLADLAKPGNLQQVTPPPAFQAPPNQFNGFEGTGGKIAGLATHLLEGISKGRSMAFARSEQQKSASEKSILMAVQAVGQSSLPDSLKQEQTTELYRMLRDTVLGPDAEKKQGKGSQPKDGSNQAPEHPGNHILGAIKGMLNNVLGPGEQKQAYTPDQIKEKTDKVFAAIGNHQNSVQAKVGEADQQLQARYTALSGPNGEPPTADKLSNDAEFNRIRGAGQVLTGGQPLPFESQLDKARTQKLEEAKISNEAAGTVEKKQAGDKDVAEAEAARALAAQRKQETENLKNQGPFGNLKVNGNLERSIERSKILSAPPGTYPDYIVKGAREDQKSADQEAKAKETRITIAQQKIGEAAAGATGSKEDKVSYVPGGRSVANPVGDIGIDTMAWEFINTGHVPFTGMGSGKGGKNKREAAIARSGEILKDLHLTPSDLPALRGALKSETKALGNITSMGSAVQQFEGTLIRNTDLAKTLSEKFKRGDNQIYNRVLGAFKTTKGDPEALNLAAQLHGMSREWAKIMAGQTSSAGVGISEAKDTDALISKAMSDGQLNSLIENVIKPDAQNRTKAIEEQRESLIQQLRQGLGQVNPSEAPPKGQPQGAPPPGQADAGKAAAGAAGPPSAATPQYRQTATNPKTGEKVGLDATGKWVPIKPIK